VWWNFAGGAANMLLTQLLEEALGARVSADNFKLTFREKAGVSATAIVDAVAVLRGANRPSPSDAARMFQPGPSARLSKFAPCLPEALQQELGARGAFDVEGARQAVRDELTVFDSPSVS
jgi:hypothetical protein